MSERISQLSERATAVLEMIAAGSSYEQIRARILKLNLVDQLDPHEQSELHRISALDPKEPEASDAESANPFD